MTIQFDEDKQREKISELREQEEEGLAQVLSKKYRGKKVFLIAPLHHHFEALGWPPYKITMRFWVLAVVFAILGTIVALLR